MLKTLSLVVAFLAFSSPVWAVSGEEKHTARVTEIIEDKTVEVVPGVNQPYQKALARLADGTGKGNTVPIELGGIVASNDNQRMKPGDNIVLSHIRKVDGSDVFLFTDFIRGKSLLFLTIAFALSVVIIGRLRGLTSFLGLAISFVVLLKYILPKIVAGYDPVVVAVSGSFVILLVTLYLAHGLSRKTTAAVIGTVLSLVITAILARYFVWIARLSGYATEDAALLSMFPGVNLNLQGIFLAGIIIGALGVLGDVTIGQAACVFELREANKNLSLKELYKRALRVGQHHIASLVNTLVLAYAGASLPLLLIFAISGGEPLSLLINREMFASEVVRTLVGSLGLVSAVPITTAIASYLSTTNFS